MLLDKYLPKYHFNEIHSVKINAKVEDVMKAVKELKTSEISRVMSLMFKIRTIPSMLRKDKKAILDNDIAMLEAMYKNNFFLLEENENEIVLGLIGKFWQLRDPSQVKISSKEEFFEFADPSYGIVATNMLFSKGRLSTETRIVVKNKSSRKKFKIYWFVIRGGSGIIRRVWLKAIKKKAEN